MSPIEHCAGSYCFLPGGTAYSGGVRAQPGYALIRATLPDATPYIHGLEAVSHHLGGLGRPLAALCAVELRVLRPLSFAAVAALNAGYIARLGEYGLLVDGRSPLARTNVAPEIPVLHSDEVMLHAFVYTVPHSSDLARAGFALSGIGEVRDDASGREAIVRVGDRSDDALREKAIFVLDAVERQLAALGSAWIDVTHAAMYTVHLPLPTLTEHVLTTIGPAARYGVHWFYSRPPIEEIEFEFDVRGLRGEEYL